MGTKVNLDKVNFKELSEKINLLNESGLLAKKMGKIGKTKEQLVEEFVAAVNGIPDDKETGEWTGPLEVAEYYNTITETVQEEKPKPEKVEKPPKEKKAPKEKKEKPKKEKKEEDGKEEKTPHKTGMNLDEYGFRVGTASHRSAEMIMAGSYTKDAAAKVIEKEFGKEYRVALGRVNLIVAALKRKKIVPKLLPEK